MATCRDCGREKRLHRRGLCAVCHAKPGSRERFPPVSPKAFGNGDNRDQTEAELDAIIAEQRRNLPAWWDRETARVRAGEDV